ncbi:tRNA (cytidine(56)-2'-O)-methyltransferase [Candidatus Micrarchaeota archaeon]|nr:tRNA (cytidine(56)-2'-O)-methyltransferase [Candidatus Micrarchaeota archaeon]
MEIVVLRLGHRLPRDERISTHVCLVARAFGASSIIYSGQKDHSLEKSVGTIVDNWGGDFSVEYDNAAIGRIKRLKKEGYTVVHASMYGEPVEEKKGELAKLEKTLVVVGGEKVPPEVYELANFNVAVGSQPHSEVAALAILLDRMMEGRELERGFDSNFGGKIRLEPSKKWKNIIKKE